MSYVISNEMLDVDYRKQHIHNLLDIYLAGGDIYESEVMAWGLRTLERGDWFYGVEKLPKDCWIAGIKNRITAIIELYENIKRDGYDGSVISVYFDKQTGQVHTYDGFHRLSIMDYLGMTVDCNCVVSEHHPDPKQRGDFPLRDTLVELNSGKNIYQPINDQRVDGFKLWRPDCQHRLAAIEKYLVSGTVLDCGCETGWYLRMLSRRGYTVLGVDKNPKRLAVARYLATIENTRCSFLEGDWTAAFMAGNNYDNVLMLSVLHHDFLEHGVDDTLESLETLRGRCRRLFVELPLSAKTVKWLPTDKQGLWNFSLDGLTKRLADITGMRLFDVVYPYLKDRPLIVLSQ